MASSQSALASDITAYVRPPLQSSDNDPIEAQFYQTYNDISFTKYINDYINTAKIKSKKNQSSGFNINDITMLSIEQKFLFQIVIIEDTTQSVLQKIDHLERKITDLKNKQLRKKALVSSIEDDQDVDGEENNNSNDDNGNKTYGFGNSSSKVFKLTLQDKQGNMYYAITLGANLSIINDFIVDLNSPTQLNSILGTKIIINENTIFNRGIFQLRSNKNYTYLGIQTKIIKWNENLNSKMYNYWQHRLVELQEQNVINNTNSKKRPLEEL